MNKTAACGWGGVGEGEDVSDSIFNGINLHVRGDEWLFLGVTENKVPRWERAPPLPIPPQPRAVLFFLYNSLTLAVTERREGERILPESSCRK